jgi:hypothetical protein
MKAIMVRMSDGTANKLKQRAGKRGVNAVVVGLIEAWVGGDASKEMLATVDSKHAEIASMIAKVEEKHRSGGMESEDEGYACVGCGVAGARMVKRYGREEWLCLTCRPA